VFESAQVPMLPKYIIFESPTKLFTYSRVLGFCFLGISIFILVATIKLSSANKQSLLPKAIFFIALTFPVLCSYASTKFEYSREQVRNGWNDQTNIKIIQTPEIIRILETENIVYVATSHSQEIHIQLKDGRRFKGTYDQSEAGPYSNHEQLFDIYNLARHIKNNRPEKEVKHWSMAIQ